MSERARRLRVNARARHVATWVAGGAVIAVLCGALITEVHREVIDPGNSDSIAFATGARLVFTDAHHLYNPLAQQRVEAGLLHVPPAAHFLNPFTNIAAGAAILSPLARFDLRTGSVIFAAVSMLLFAVALLLLLNLLAPLTSRPQRAFIACACVLSIPAVDAVIQWDSLLTVAALGSVLLAERRRLVVAGLLMATLVLKPQTMWLVIPALAAARSWRFLAAFLGGVAVWLAVSIFIAGPESLSALAALITRQHVAETGRTVGIPSLVAAASGTGSAGFVAAAVLGALATLTLILMRRRLAGHPVAAVAIGIPLSILCAPHVTAQDLMLAAVPLAVVARAWPRIAIAEALAISAVFQVQLALPSPLRHFEPLVLAALACTAAAAMTHRKHSRRERSSQPMDPGGTTQRHSWPAARAIRSKSAS